MKRYSVIEISRHENNDSRTFIDRRIAVIGDSSAHVKSRWNEMVSKMHPTRQDKPPQWKGDEAEGTMIWSHIGGSFIYTALIMKFEERF